MSDIEFDFKPTSRLGVFVVYVGNAGGEPFTDEVHLLTVDGRTEAAEKLAKRFSGIDRDSIDQMLSEEAARVFRNQDVDAVERASERAKENGLLTFETAEAYRRAVAGTRSDGGGKKRMSLVEAARALASVPDAVEDDVVRLLGEDAEVVRASFREGGGDEAALRVAPAVGAGVLIEPAGKIIPISWEASRKRSADTGTIRTPLFSDRLSIENASRRRSAAKKIARAHDLDETDELLNSLERTLVALGQLDADARNEVVGDDCAGTDADLIMGLARELHVELFHTPGARDAECYATIPVGEHHEVWLLDSSGFKRWLSHAFYRKYGRATSETSIQTAKGALIGMALFESPEHEVFVRRGFANGKLYIDLANDDGEAIEIDDTGYRTVEPISKGVHFIRKGGMLPLPPPADGGSVDELRSVLNVRNSVDWDLVKGFLLSVLHPTGPYLGLGPNGEQDSGKSCFSRTIRRTVDPSDRDLRRPITNEPDLAIAASSSLIVAVDNLSKLSDNLSDAYCSLATGASLTKRKLYTDNDEVGVFFKRPVILNGINNVITRPDAADRILPVRLQRIPKAERLTERKLEAMFVEMRPRVFGALCRAVSAALRRRDEVHVDQRERMLDILEWVTAAEEELGIEPGGFQRAYSAKVIDAAREALENAPVALEVLEFMRRRRAIEAFSWTGTCKQLRGELKRQLEEDEGVPVDWPKTPHKLAHALRRAAPLLRREGVEVVEPDSRARPRNYTIRTVSEPDPDDEPSFDDDPGAETSAENTAQETGNGASDVPDISDVCGGPPPPPDAERVNGRPRPGERTVSSAGIEVPRRPPRDAPRPAPNPPPRNVGNVGNVGDCVLGTENVDSDPTFAGACTSGNDASAPEKSATSFEHVEGLAGLRTPIEAGLFPDDGPDPGEGH